MKIRWLRTALLNLDEEAAYIAAEDPAAARLVVARILEAVACWPVSLHRRPGRVRARVRLLVPKPAM